MAEPESKKAVSQSKGSLRSVTFEKIFMELLPGDLRTPEGGILPERKVEERPSYERYRTCHDEVGREWNWHLRPRINNRAAIEAELAHPHTRFGIFLHQGQEIGYYLVVSEDGTDVELSDFGFYPQHRSQGYGRQALVELARDLFSSGVSRIWLSTRSTNDERVPRFYSDLGFQEYKRETKSESYVG